MHTEQSQSPAPRSTIALTYAMVSSLWIVGSDAVFGFIHAPAGLHAVKGVLFVSATSLMLHCLVGRYARRLQAHEHQLHRAERMRTLGEGTARISHELRNVLMAIRTLSSVLQRFTTDCPQAARTSQLLHTSLERGELLLSEVLGFAAERPVRAEHLQIARWLDDFAEQARHTVKPTIDVAVSVLPPQLQIDADPSQLDQLLTNLIVNASDAISDRGKISITASPANGSGVVIAVRDDGAGIPDDVVCRIFDPLFTTKSKGTGLGLPVVSRIARAHGGTVSVESRVGEGTEFRVFLPQSM